MKEVLWCFMYIKEETGENYKGAYELWREREESNDENMYIVANLLLKPIKLHFNSRKYKNCWN